MGGGVGLLLEVGVEGEGVERGAVVRVNRELVHITTTIRILVFNWYSYLSAVGVVYVDSNAITS